MADRFDYSVYVGFHPADASIANELIEKLRLKGMGVCSEGSGTRETIEEYLRSSRSMVLLVSSNSLGPGWAALERRTALFRDPRDPRRRFVPVLVDDCRAAIPEALRQYGFIDYSRRSKKAFEAVEVACRSASRSGKPVKSHKVAVREFPLSNTYNVADMDELEDGSALLIAAGREIDLYELGTHTYKKRFTSSKGKIKCVSLAPSGDRLAVGSDDSSIQVLHLNGGSLQPLPSLHQGEVVCVEWSPDGHRLYSAGGDSSIRYRQFGLTRGNGELFGHAGGIGQVAISPDGQRAASASYDNRIKIWDLGSGKCSATFGDHGFPVNSVAWLPDGRYLLSASDECTVRLWDVSAQSCLVSMEGHRDSIWRVVYSPVVKIAASGSWDNTVRLWEVWSGRCLQVLKFPELVNSVRFGRDGRRLYVAAGNMLYVHRFNRNLLEKVATLETDSRRYSNAKVVLVGESMAGKSHLAGRLVEDKWIPVEATHGMRVWPLKLPIARDEGTEREVWLWDLAGQPDYRIVHQIFLDETSVALVVFDPSIEDALQKIKHWEKALRQAVGHDPAKILVASKSDVCPLTITRDKLGNLVAERGYAAFVQTSAHTGKGRNELLSAIAGAIPWDRTPSITTPRLFKVLKDGIVRIKEDGLALIQFAALRQQLQMAHPKERFEEADLRTVVRLLAGQGLVKPLKFGDVILLKPELMNSYAAAVARAAREHPEGIGCIEEQTVLAGQFDFQGMPRVSRADEDILLRAVVDTFIERSLCFRQETGGGDRLVFPAHYNLELEMRDQPPDLVVYQFAGNLGIIYTTLVVRLRYTRGFEEPSLYKNAAMFRTNEGHRLGFSFHAESQGTGTLKIFFDPAVPEDTRVTFLRYIHEHLLKYAIDVERQRLYVCPDQKCGRPFESLEALRTRKAAGESYIRCVYCDTQIQIYDLVERKFVDERFHRKVQELDEQASIRLGSESKEIRLVGHAMQAAAEANQIFRQILHSDHGIDAEIEFRNDRGEASGQRIYLQLKSGDSYTYIRSDGREIFTVKKPRHLQYWQDQAYPVFLVLMDAGGSARWMNVTGYLRNRRDKESLQIEFVGEAFNAYSIMRLASTLMP